MRHAGALRIDHVLGLMRLFVIPHGMSAGGRRLSALAVRGDAAASRRKAERWRCIIIGEDLGTVPENFAMRPGAPGAVVLSRHAVRARTRRIIPPPDAIRKMRIATFNTHDLADLRGLDVRARSLTKRAIGVDPGETDEERAARRARRLRAGLEAEGSASDFRGGRGVSGRDADAAGVGSARGRARHGGSDQRAGNGRATPELAAAMPLTVEELTADQALQRIAASFAQRRARLSQQPDRRTPASRRRCRRASAARPRCRGAES